MSEFKFIHCPECDCTNGHYPDCNGYEPEKESK